MELKLLDYVLGEERYNNYVKKANDYIPGYIWRATRTVKGMYYLGYIDDEKYGTIFQYSFFRKDRKVKGTRVLYYYLRLLYKFRKPLRWCHHMKRIISTK